MRAALLTICALALAGCSNEGKLMTLASDDGPEEFAIVPTRPLELPPDLAQLPAPTPGGAPASTVGASVPPPSSIGGSSCGTSSPCARKRADRRRRGGCGRHRDRCRDAVEGRRWW